MSASISQKEVAHFAKDSGLWWDESGPFAILHRLNSLRMRYIKNQIENHFDRAPRGLKVLDIGCGGGLVCEPLARMGTRVTGIDADEQAIEVARDHAQRQELDINYIHGAIESQSGTYDIVTALEVVEHVADMESFITSAAQLCRPGGLMIFSTLNRTPQSFLLGIVAAEYILRWVPRGTHSWRQFIRPSEMTTHLENRGVAPVSIDGYGLNPATGEFELSRKYAAVNYFLTAEKKA